MKYIIIDSMNLFFRARHVAAKGTDAWTKVGFALHLTLTSAAKVWREQKGEHVVWAMEGGKSWRRQYDARYKGNRDEKRAAMTEDEQEEDAMFFEAYNALNEFLDKRTNITMLQAENCEGDDMIARWVQNHPDDEHCIISSDTDFPQLLTDKVTQFDGVANYLHTKDAVFDDKGKQVINKKTQLPRTHEPEWELFLKIIRGDKADNVFSAFPGARENGTKNKIGIRDAYDDMANKGYNWNNFMLNRWIDHNGDEHKVLDRYEANRKLIDLTCQPQEILDKMDIAIANCYTAETKKQVGAHLLKFCGKWELTKVAEFADRYADYMNSKLPEFK